METLWHDSRGTNMQWHGATFSDGQKLGLKVDQEFYLGQVELWCFRTALVLDWVGKLWGIAISSMVVF